MPAIEELQAIQARQDQLAFRLEELLRQEAEVRAEMDRNDRRIQALMADLGASGTWGE